MRVLIIDEVAKERINQVIGHAEDNVFSFDDLLDIYNKQATSAGDMTAYTTYLHRGYKVVYSLEMQPMGKCRHLSVSVDKAGKLPSIDAVELIMKEFGFRGSIEDCNVSMEEFAPNHQAVNVIEVIK